MGKAEIRIVVQDGKSIQKVDLKNVNQAEIAIIISSLELTKLEMLSKYNSNRKRINPDGK